MVAGRLLWTLAAMPLAVFAANGVEARQLPCIFYCHQYDYYELSHTSIKLDFKGGIKLANFYKQGTIQVPNRGALVKQGIIYFYGS
ncbi:hypothetical protein PG997_007408 [Apiospora hydei]|uniref:Uncharacterized protein n=1 Tax=Apiospora hydei TaxID=1337664 RepID=A0ABR1W7X1_9PEZI